jgi:hypothetical protein
LNSRQRFWAANGKFHDEFERSKKIENRGNIDGEFHDEAGINV